MLCFNVKQNSTSDFDTIMDGQLTNMMGRNICDAICVKK